MEKHLYVNAQGEEQEDEAGAGGGGVGGGCVYINDVVPSGAGNVGDKTYLAGSNDEILLTCSSDDPDNLRVYIIALIGNSNLRPAVTVNGVAVGNWNYTAYQTDNRALFRGYADIALPGGGTITVEHEDGATAEATVSADAKPVISSATFIGAYPGAQTELKAGDGMTIRIQTDLQFDFVEIADYEACSPQTTGGAPTTDRNVGVLIADRGNVAVLRPARVRVRKPSGTWSDWVDTDDFGAVEPTNLVNCNNLYPSVDTMNQGSITYPVTQEAIKNAEDVTIHATCSNFDVITYSSPNGQLTIPNTSTYQEDKANVSRNSGDYNVSIVNYRVVATRAANDSSVTRDLVVYIAHVAAEISMGEPASRLRSGGNDGTSIQNHTITLSSNQRLISAPTVGNPPAGAGVWSGVFSGGPTVWTRTLQVHDDDTPGAYGYQALSAYNLANIETTAYTGDSNYTIGGFVSRALTLPAFANEVDFNAKTTDYSKALLTWSTKSLPNRRAFNTVVPPPDPNSWCWAGTIGVHPTTSRILDTSATDAQSSPSTVTVEEAV